MYLLDKYWVSTLLCEQLRVRRLLMASVDIIYPCKERQLCRGSRNMSPFLVAQKTGFIGKSGHHHRGFISSRPEP